MGKRNIKTAIAVFLSVLISRMFKLEYPFFTVIAAIFSMENSIASSYKAGVYRLIGTLVGAFVGVIFTFIGIVIAVTVNYLIFPPNNLAQLRKSLDTISAKISAAIIDFICLGKNIDLDSLSPDNVEKLRLLNICIVNTKEFPM